MKGAQNLAVGNFLYCLGAAMVRQLSTESPPAVISFLQQLPSGGDWADVLIELPGKLLLVEFFSSSRSALYQQARHTAISTQLYSRPDLRDLSSHMHWCIQAQRTEGHVLRASPYLGPAKPEPKETFEAFIQHVIAYSLRQRDPWSREQCRDYLMMVAAVPRRDAGDNISMICKLGPNGELCLGTLEDLEAFVGK